jgi:FHA domain-containing protein
MTTHDPRGGGRPRLIFALGGTAQPGASQREFDLVPGVTVIGSGPDADLCLEGLAARHAEIRRDERDEYIYIDLGSGAPGRVDGQAVSGKPLRTGDRIELGDWTLSYFREEFADHGLPFGGRHGGNPEPVQAEPRPRGTSPEGGKDRTDGDPGEYF